MKQWLEHTDQRGNSLAHGFGSLPVDTFHKLALFAIGGTGHPLRPGEVSVDASRQSLTTPGPLHYS